MPIFILLIAFLFTQSIVGHSFVLVHIGDKLPEYFVDAVTQARLFNPTCDMYVIANRSALRESLMLLKQYNVKLVIAEKLQKTPEHTLFLQNSRLQPGFWRSASERFLYLHDFMQQYDINDVFHCENDIMLYVDFDELLPVLKGHYKGIAAVFDSDYRCIPGFVYIAHKEVMKLLAEYFASQARFGKNDMEVIAKFRECYERDIIDGLPIITPEYIKCFGLKNDLGQIPANSVRFAQHLEVFDSLFDGAAIGQYLGGTIDPKKGPGFINETTVFNPSLLTYDWVTDKKGRRVPYAVFLDKRYRINNLHIHSKKLHGFSSIKKALN